MWDRERTLTTEAHGVRPPDAEVFQIRITLGHLRQVEERLEGALADAEVRQIDAGALVFPLQRSIINSVRLSESCHRMLEVGWIRLVHDVRGQAAREGGGVLWGRPRWARCVYLLDVCIVMLMRKRICVTLHALSPRSRAGWKLPWRAASSMM